MRLTELYCISCGEKHGGDLDPGGNPLDCKKCSRKPINMATLLLGQSILDVTLKRCAQCKTPSPMGNKFCYKCGHSF